MEASSLPYPESAAPGPETELFLVPDHDPPAEVSEADRLIVFPTRAITVDNLAQWAEGLFEDGKVIIHDWEIDTENRVTKPVSLSVSREEFLRFCEDPWTEDFFTAYESLDQEHRLGELGRGFRHWRKANPGSRQEDG